MSDRDTEPTTRGARQRWAYKAAYAQLRTWKAVAKAIGVDRGTLKRWRTGEIETPMKSIDALEELVGKPAGWIAAGQPALPSPVRADGDDLLTPRDAIRATAELLELLDRVRQDLKNGAVTKGEQAARLTKYIEACRKEVSDSADESN